MAADVKDDFLATTFAVSILLIVHLLGAIGMLGSLRVLVNKRRAVVDLVVDDEVEVLLGGVLGDLGEGEFFVGHCGLCGVGVIGLW